ncbi:hypothetical protein [Brevibacterium sandarakinum]|uniref:hypothetical protein n=1 Tax=Brevibacterium sandarakinum TaxID=629680 RepID=UPI00264C5921|nr:hypothetical protein [Brevibacterium sandarakinum]MDN5659013.1 hypothetical protein [Brevibacterium sandarakinum]
MIDRTHKHCVTCYRLGEEAERTAKEQGTDHWSSYDMTPDGTEHSALYLDKETP